MRIISNAKAREGKVTFARRLLSEWLLFERRCNNAPINYIFPNSTCSFGVTALAFSGGISLYIFELTYDLKQSRADHISITMVKKGCKKKTEEVQILLY